MNIIKLGSKGEDVKVLQKYLGLNPDGDFGPKTLLKVKPIAHIYLLVVIVISFVIFSNENLNDMMLYFSKMFGNNTTFINETFNATILNNIRSIIIGVLCVIRIPQMFYGYIKKNVVLNIIVMVILLGISLFLIYMGYNDPFLYFRF